MLLGLVSLRVMYNIAKNNKWGWDVSDVIMGVYGFLLPVIFIPMALAVEGKNCFRKKERKWKKFIGTKVNTRL